MEQSFNINIWDKCRKTRFYHQGQSHWNIPVVRKRHLKVWYMDTQGSHKLIHMHAHNPIRPSKASYSLTESVFCFFSPPWDELGMWMRSQRHPPSAPVWLQKSGNRGPRRSPARGRMEAPPGCGSAPAHLPRRLCPLEGKKRGKTKWAALLRLMSEHKYTK